MSPDGQQLHVAGVAVGQLDGLGAGCLQRGVLAGGRHEVHQLATMWRLQLSLRDRCDRAAEGNSADNEFGRGDTEGVRL